MRDGVGITARMRKTAISAGRVFGWRHAIPADPQFRINKQPGSTRCDIRQRTLNDEIFNRIPQGGYRVVIHLFELLNRL
ncbi:hypothetical protein SRABI106_04879 [Rahnella aquatilis]|nr:hypothetical protein SRABI106_04879 [Rahnella aquatilis]